MGKNFAIFAAVTFITIVSITLALFFLFFNTLPTGNSTVQTKETTYTAIVVYDTNNQAESLGKIWVHDNAIEHDITELLLADYLNSHKTGWQERTFTYPVQAVSQTNAPWETFTTTRLGDEDFLLGLYLYLKVNIGDSYTYRLGME